MSAVRLALSATTLSNKGVPLNARIGIQIVSDLKVQTPADKTLLQPRDLLYVKLTVQNVLEEGEWETNILNRGTKIGTVKVFRFHVPFGVRLDVADPDHPELSFEKGSKVAVSLSNPDSVTYPTAWDLVLEGKGGIPESTMPTSKRTLVLPAKSGAQIQFQPPPDDWFDSSLSGLFKDDTANARIVLRLRPTSCMSPNCTLSDDVSTRIIPFKAHLAYYSRWAKEWIGGALILFVVLLGALFSVILNAYLPNQRRRIDIKRQLHALEARIRSLPMSLSSRLRVLAGVERRRLFDQISVLRWIDPDFATKIAELKQGVERLSKRTDFLQQLGHLRLRLNELRADDQKLIPTRVRHIEDSFDVAVDCLKRPELTDANFIELQRVLDDIQSLITTLEQPDAKFGTELSNHARRLRAEMMANGAWRPLYRDMAARLEPLFNAFFEIDPDAIQAERFAETDRVLARVDLAKEYAEKAPLRRDAADGNQPRLVLLGTLEEDFITDLLSEGWERFHAAQLIVRQLAEGYFKDDVVRAILSGHPQVSIQHGTSEARRYEALDLSVQFAVQDLNHAGVLEEFIAVWSFGHDNLTPEKGWDVMHYFPRAGAYVVSVTFEHNRDGVIRNPTNQQVVVTSEDITVLNLKQVVGYSGWWLGAVQLFVVLFPAILALFSGAREQIMKLDLLPALIAIFLLGFASDQIKSLLTRQA